MDKTLYVSDLDGTLLNRQSRLSKFTLEALNRLLREGRSEEHTSELQSQR